jgi:hypothetical protein
MRGSPTILPRRRQRKRKPRGTLAIDIAAENECYDAIRTDAVTVAMRDCSGSRVAWSHGTGTYDWLAECLSDTLQVDRLVLEYDTDDVGGCGPLRFLPKGKVVALRLVSSNGPRLETQEELLRRIDEATKSSVRSINSSSLPKAAFRVGRRVTAPISTSIRSGEKLRISPAARWSGRAARLHAQVRLAISRDTGSQVQQWRKAFRGSLVKSVSLAAFVHSGLQESHGRWWLCRIAVE